MMKTKHIWLISFLLALLVWSMMTWPLARYAASGIPAASYTQDSNQARYMIPGDHLQFLYHLWLAQDTLLGKTPLFYNLYEFNTGDDAGRYSKQTYYLPFSLVYAIGALLAGHAAGWNITALFSLWMTAGFTGMLARRYTNRTCLQIAAAAVSILLPYRWFTLCGGSPTGLGMMWVPILLYGLDLWVRDNSFVGALLAGAVMYVSGWSDSHVFFFGALVAPCWCLFAYGYNRDQWMPKRIELFRYAVSVLPLVFFGVLILLQVLSVQSGLEDTELHESGRSLHEVALFSPHLKGVLSAGHGADSMQLYLGWPLVSVLLVSFVAAAFSMVRLFSSSWRKLLMLLLLAAGIAGSVLLSAGVNNPGGARLWEILVKVIPPYGMIRQPAKIYVLLPSLMAIALVICLQAVNLNRKWVLIICVTVPLVLFADYQRLVRPKICLLDNEQGAYAAIHRHAAIYEKRPGLMVIPIWPGNSHWSSLYQHYVSLYRIRMVNGYRPTARQTYVDDIYLPYESFNKGGYSDTQLDGLIKRGIHYLILHEDAFPEKVSPFAVGSTLQGLLEHPRIELIEQDGSVWAFYILAEPSEDAVQHVPWSQHSPARLWQAEKSRYSNADIIEEDAASGHQILKLIPESSFLSSYYPMVYKDGLNFQIRCRGNAEFSAYIDGVMREPFQISLQDSDWNWISIPIPAFEGYRKMPLELYIAEGELDVDVIIPVAGDWPALDPGEDLWIPAAALFHAGYTDLESGAVMFRPERDPADVILYGPKIPLPEGEYEMSWIFSSGAPDGSLLGESSRRYPGEETGPVQHFKGSPSVYRYIQDHNIRVALNFRYLSSYPLTVKGLNIRRVK